MKKTEYQKLAKETDDSTTIVWSKVCPCKPPLALLYPQFYINHSEEFICQLDNNNIMEGVVSVYSCMKTQTYIAMNNQSAFELCFKNLLAITTISFVLYLQFKSLWYSHFLLHIINNLSTVCFHHYHLGMILFEQGNFF